MSRGLKQLVGIAVLGGLGYLVFYVPVRGQTPYEHAAAFVRNKVTLDDGGSAFPHADQTLRLDAEAAPDHWDREAQNNPTAKTGKRIMDYAKARERRMERKQKQWQ